MLLALACAALGFGAIWRLSGDPKRYQWWKRQLRDDETIPPRVIYTGLVLGTLADMLLGTAAVVAYIGDSWLLLTIGVIGRFLLNALGGRPFRKLVRQNPASLQE